MKSFVEQQGLPVIDLAREPTGYRATQSRYLALGSQAPQQQWIIPFCVRRGATPTCALLDVDAPSTNLAVAGSGVLVPNAGGTGYYRYTLSEADWNSLLTEAASLPAGEALAAIDSLWAQAASGKLKMSLLLRAAAAFAANPNSTVATYGGERLARWRRVGLIDSTAEYRKVMHGVLAATLEALGSDPRARVYAKDAPDRQKLRGELITLMAMEARDAPLRRQLDAAAKAYLAGDEQALDESQITIALGVYLQEGGIARTRELYTRLTSSPNELFRGAALSALAETERAQDAKWLLGRIDARGLRSTESVRLLARLMQRPGTRDVAFEWLTAHYDAFVNRMGLFGALSVPRMPEAFCSAKRADEIQALLPRVAVRGELIFQRTLETVRNCAALKAARGAEISAALRQAAAQ
jgi:aminopeptidase N